MPYSYFSNVEIRFSLDFSIRNGFLEAVNMSSRVSGNPENSALALYSQSSTIHISHKVNEHRILKFASLQITREIANVFKNYLKTMTINSFIWISYTPLIWNKFPVGVISSFDPRTASLQIKWDKPPVSIHLCNHCTPPKWETHRAPRSSRDTEKFVPGAYQVGANITAQ